MAWARPSQGQAVFDGFGLAWGLRKPKLPQAKPKPGLSGQAGLEQHYLIAAKIESPLPTINVFCSLEWDCMVWKTDCNFSGLTSFWNPLKCCLLPAKSYEKVLQATNITVPPLWATVPFPIVCACELVDHLYQFPPLLPLINTDLLPVLVSCSPSPTIWMLPKMSNQRSLDSES